MKKILITLLILSVALTSIFAIDGLKVGGEVGYTRFGINIKMNDVKANIGVNAFTFSGVAEYEVAKGIDVVAKAGLNVYGKPVTKVTYGGETHKEVADETVPVHFTAYVGGKYTYTINDQFSAYAGAGFDLTVGKLDRNSEKAGCFFGAKAEIAGKYQINDKLAVTLGGGFTWIFADTSEELKDLRELFSGASFFEYKFGAAVGVTYTL